MRIVELPGGGTARVRELTGFDEERFVGRRALPAALAVSELLGACVEVDGASASIEQARTMLIGDRDFAMLQLRALTLGERVLAVVTCPACMANVDVTFNLADVPVERRPQARDRYEIDDEGRPIAFRLPCGADCEAILGMDLDAAEHALLARCVEGGSDDLSEAARQAVAAAMEQLAPQVELELDIRCPECAAASLVPFDCTAFFLREFRLEDAGLLREIHALALTYHWSEAQILGLPRSRRRAYLDLVRESVAS